MTLKRLTSPPHVNQLVYVDGIVSRMPFKVLVVGTGSVYLQSLKTPRCFSAHISKLRQVPTVIPIIGEIP